MSYKDNGNKRQNRRPFNEGGGRRSYPNNSSNYQGNGNDRGTVQNRGQYQDRSQPQGHNGERPAQRMRSDHPQNRNGAQPDRSNGERTTRYRKPELPLLMVTRDIDNPDDVSKTIIDYHNQRTIEWVHRHIHWAMYNNKTVLLLPNTDEEGYKKVEDHDIPDFDEQGEPEEEGDEEEFN